MITAPSLAEAGHVGQIAVRPLPPPADAKIVANLLDDLTRRQRAVRERVEPFGVGRIRCPEPVRFA